jgi:signal transduction histidine kinase
MARIALRGLRARLIVALAAVSALSLGVAALALLSPLQERLRAQALKNLTAAVIANKPYLQRLGATPGGVTPASAMSLAHSIAHRTHAHTIVLDARGRVLAATDLDPGEAAQDARALRTPLPLRSIARSGEEREARVALLVRTRQGPFVLALRKSLSDVQSTVGVVRRAFLVAVLFGLGGALLVGIALSGRLVRRLTSLRDTALRVARIGPVADVEPDPGRDEVGDLARAFATMQARLREQEQARRTFVSTASHELRTPLTSLQLMLESMCADLDADPPDLPAARDRARRSEVQVRRLSRLAGDLLDLSRVDAGIALRREPVDLVDVARSVTSELAAPAPIELAANGACWAAGDPGAVARIVRILVDNALRFTPPGRAVHIACEMREGAATIAVRDDGPGVPADERERIFERFQRGSDTGGAAAGFGLGLAIGRELAERMGGALRLQETDRGACFVLQLEPAALPYETA